MRHCGAFPIYTSTYILYVEENEPGNAIEVSSKVLIIQTYDRKQPGLKSSLRCVGSSAFNDVGVSYWKSMMNPSGKVEITINIDAEP